MILWSIYQIDIKKDYNELLYKHAYYFDGNNMVNNMFILGINEPLPDLYDVNFPINQCYVCDIKLDYYRLTVLNSIIQEATYPPHIASYPLTQRCQICKKGKYGMVMTNNISFIMARHYKWMTFLSGFYDLNSDLSNLPIDIANVIILLYQYIR